MNDGMLSVNDVFEAISKLRKRNAYTVGDTLNIFKDLSGEYRNTYDTLHDFAVKWDKVQTVSGTEHEEMEFAPLNIDDLFNDRKENYIGEKYEKIRLDE